MVVGRVEHGQIRLAAELPEAWEGKTVTIECCTPEDKLPDLEQRLAALHVLGPMEFEPGEKKSMEQALAAMNDLSRGQLQQLADHLP